MRQWASARLHALGSGAAVWHYSSPIRYSAARVRLSVAQVSYGPFRHRAAAVAAPLRRDRPGYAYHLDTDRDRIACMVLAELVVDRSSPADIIS